MTRKKLQFDTGPLFNAVTVGIHGYDSQLTRSLYGPPSGPQRTQILNYGGGVQTAAICALVVTGQLPRPDHIIMADTGREKTNTFRYLENHVAPVLAAHGLRVEIAPHSLSTVDLFAHNGQVLMPMFTTQENPENPGRLLTKCSGEWKTRVVRRYMRSIGIRQADNWIGYSPDEASRLKISDVEWSRSVFPLMDLWLMRDQAAELAKEVFGALPPKSSCINCPQQGDEQWLSLSDSELDFSELEELKMQSVDPHVYLHKLAIPIREAVTRLKEERAAGLMPRMEEVNCDSGGCWV